MRMRDMRDTLNALDVLEFEVDCDDLTYLSLDEFKRIEECIDTINSMFDRIEICMNNAHDRHMKDVALEMNY